MNVTAKSNKENATFSNSKLEVSISAQQVSVGYNGQSIQIMPEQAEVNVSTGTPVARDYVGLDPYTGDYTVTPSKETQTLQTNNLRMLDNVTIEPIPSNYGLITWNGSIITVS